MQFPHLDPVFLRLGPLEFRWYGLMYIISFIAGYFIVRSASRQRNLPLSKDDIADLVFIIAVGIILGGRSGYILFYNLAYYLSHPLRIFAVWEGGMSFHGGFIGSILAALYFSRKKKIPFFAIADICALTAPVGLGLGRIGNFINGELFGRVTDAPWGIVFPEGGPLPRHPSQLYEAFLEGPLCLLILWIIWRRNPPRGVISWSFVSLYGLFRFIVEFFREPDAQLGYFGGSFTMGQILSIPMIIGGIAMTFLSIKGREKTGG